MKETTSSLENLKTEFEEVFDRVRSKRRKKLLSKKIDPNANLVETLEILSLKDLHKIRKFWDFKGISSLNKDELIKELGDKILFNLDDWLQNLDKSNYNFINKLVKNNGLLEIQEEKFDDDTFSLIEYYRKRGVVFTGEFDDKIVFYMPQEIVIKTKEVLKREDFLTAVDGNEFLLNLIKGFLQYYGTMPIFKMEEIIENLTNQNLDKKRYISFIKEIVNYNTALEKRNSNLFLFRVEDKDWLLKETNKRDDLEYYPLKIDEVKVAGKLGHQIWNNSHGSFKKILKNKTRLNDEGTDYCIRMLTDMIQNNVDLEIQINFLKEEIGIEISNRVKNLLQNVYNNTHQWKLKGHTTNFVSIEEKQQFFSKENHSFLEDENEVKKRKDLGRNDPCYCGSGKKYKKCCLPKDQREERVFNKLHEPWNIEWDYYPIEDFINKTGYPLYGYHYFLLEITNIIGHILHIYKVYGKYKKIKEKEILDKIVDKGIKFCDYCTNECENDCLNNPQQRVSFQSLIERGFSPENYPEAIKQRKALNLFFLEIANEITSVVENEINDYIDETNKIQEIAGIIYTNIIDFVVGNCLSDCMDDCMSTPLEDEITLKEIGASEEDLYHS